MELLIAAGIRVGLGFLLGLLFGIMGLVFTFWVVPGNYAPPLWLIVIVTGIATSFAGFLAFFKPESPWRVVAIGFALAMVGGIVGAWIGFGYAKLAYPDGVRNIYLVSTPDLRSPAVMPFITGAALSATALGAIYYIFRFRRYREM